MSPRSESLNRPARLLLEKLEDRLLFDGMPTPQPAPQEAPPIEHVAMNASADMGDAAPTPEAIATAADAVKHELVLVDTSVPGYESLLDQLVSQADPERLLEVVALDPALKGPAQITQALAGRGDLDAVHLLTGASSDQLQWDGTGLTTGSLSGAADDVANWEAVLKPTGTFVIYGADGTSPIVLDGLPGVVTEETQPVLFFRSLNSEALPAASLTRHELVIVDSARVSAIKR